MKSLEITKQWEPAELRQHCWGYFQYHASQRTTVFNFYLVTCALLTTGYLHVVATSSAFNVAIILGLLFPLLSFIFWKLDCRNVEMVELAEKAMVALEQMYIPKEDEGSPTALEIFSNEAKQTREAESRISFWSWRNHYRHKHCFHLIFWSISALGILAALYAGALTIS
jgi:hypothetical protein